MLDAGAKDCKGLKNYYVNPSWDVLKLKHPFMVNNDTKKSIIYTFVDTKKLIIYTFVHLFRNCFCKLNLYFLTVSLPVWF